MNPTANTLYAEGENLGTCDLNPHERVELFRWRGIVWAVVEGAWTVRRATEREWRAFLDVVETY